MAALLLGYPDSGILSLSPYLAYHWGYCGLYVQDDIKLTTKLTVNLGLRWDIEGSPTERYNQMNRGFALGTASPLADRREERERDGLPRMRESHRRPALRRRERPAARSVQHRVQPLPAPHRRGVSDRAADGAARRLRHVLPAGIGVRRVARLLGGYEPRRDGRAAAPTAFIPATTLSNPFPNGIVQPTGASLGLNTALGSNVMFANPNRQIPHVFAVLVRRAASTAVERGGGRVVRRQPVVQHQHQRQPVRRRAQPERALSASQLQQAQANPSFLTQSVTNPFAGLIPNNRRSTRRPSRARSCWLPYPQFGQVLMAQESVGKLWYDSLQVNATKRYSTSLVASLAYTWSKNLDATAFLNSQDPRPTKALSAGRPPASPRPQRRGAASVRPRPPLRAQRRPSARDADRRVGVQLHRHDPVRHADELSRATST